MKCSTSIIAIVASLREEQFWQETLREAFYSITNSSSGFGVAVTSALLGVAHRIARTVCSALRANGHPHLFAANTNA